MNYRNKLAYCESDDSDEEPKREAVSPDGRHRAATDAIYFQDSEDENFDDEIVPASGLGNRVVPFESPTEYELENGEEGQL